MEGKTHLGIGAVTYVAICNKLPGKFSLLGMFVVIVASLLPDIDHPKSMVNKYILPFKNGLTKRVMYVCIGILVLWFDYLFTKESSLRALGVAFIAIGFSSHRNGLTHSIFGLIIFTFIIKYIGKQYGILYIEYYFLIGYGMHLLCDMMTKKGIPLFYPLTKTKYKLPITYRVGSRVGQMIEGLLILLSIIYMVYKLPYVRM